MKETRKDNLGDKAYNAIKHMILSGELKQGESVSISAMAEYLKISRTPVTSACQKLELERFLRILPKQGVVINTMSIQDVCGIYELRAAIESYSAKHCMDLITTADVIILKRLIEKQTKEAQKGNYRDLMDGDRFFHRYIFKKNVNCDLLAFFDQLCDRVYMLGAANGICPCLTESIDEHKRIVEALERRDRQGFADAIEENILNGLQRLTKRFGA